jgi:hypothetical protein
MLSVVAMRDPLLEVIAAMVRFEPIGSSEEADAPPPKDAPSDGSGDDDAPASE